jgi:phage tail P2-like protein
MDLATARVGDVPTPLRELWDADSCPDALLPWLAWAYSLDEWNAGWTPAQQRAAIKQSVAVHRYKGTIGAVREALAALGFEAQVREWFNQTPEGDPYTFLLQLNVDQEGFSLADLERMLEIVNTTKNLRSHLSEIVATVKTKAGPRVAAVAALGSETTVNYALPTFPPLLIEAGQNGAAATEEGVNVLHAVLHTELPAENYW